MVQTGNAPFTFAFTAIVSEVAYSRKKVPDLKILGTNRELPRLNSFIKTTYRHQPLELF